MLNDKSTDKNTIKNAGLDKFDTARPIGPITSVNTLADPL